MSGVASWALPLLGFIGLPGVVIWYLRDRRKDRAASNVAELTVPAEVDIRESTAWQARLVTIDQAFEQERRSWRNAINDRDQEIDRQREELAYRDHLLAQQEALIQRLRRQVAELEHKLAQAAEQLSAVRSELNTLAAMQTQTQTGPHHKGDPS